MNMAQWEQAIEWCRKSIASDPMWWAFADVAAASAFAGRDAEARAAVADLLKLQPGFTVQQWMDFKSISDNETFQRGNQGIGEGLRKAGCQSSERHATRQRWGMAAHCDVYRRDPQCPLHVVASGSSAQIAVIA